MAPHRRFSADDEGSPSGDASYEECPVCRQEFADGICPINSTDCPYRDDLDDEDEDDFGFGDADDEDRVEDDGADDED
ncbi:MAG: hypothetical protein H3C50_08250 [Kiritimatiellae bacterium]|nr:hypothetical protein [Kiritimatiellia bacterium]MCO5061078.1 hypothetical protein [Kiritimatiellia bacterium]MCO5067866.1 hypothetical protein [Kiritimatiellia bacterium]